jgi:hypothetical protein
MKSELELAKQAHKTIANVVNLIESLRDSYSLEVVGPAFGRDGHMKVFWSKLYTLLGLIRELAEVSMGELETKFKL